MTHTHTHTDTTGVPTNGFWLFCVSFSVLFLLSVSVEWTNERASECQQTQRHCKKERERGKCTERKRKRITFRQIEKLGSTTKQPASQPLVSTRFERVNVIEQIGCRRLLLLNTHTHTHTNAVCLCCCSRNTPKLVSDLDSVDTTNRFTHKPFLWFDYLFVRVWLCLLLLICIPLTYYYILLYFFFFIPIFQCLLFNAVAIRTTDKTVLIKFLL